MAYTNSPLVDVVKLTRHHSGQRTHTIDRITPHCLVGQATAKSIADYFYNTSRESSCNYGIGTEGKVALVVEEKNRSWCTSSNANDQRAITIECASDKTHPYTFNDAVYEKLVLLCADICKRNGKTKVVWIDDKEKALAYQPAAHEMQFTVHRWFANKSCPGAWMYARMGDLTDKVNALLAEDAPKAEKEEKEEKVLYRVQVGAYTKKENAEKMLAKVKAAGFSAFIATEQKATEAPKPEVKLAVGDAVKLDPNATVYGKTTKFKSWIYNKTLYVRQIDGDKVVISTVKTGAVTGATDIKYLTKI